MRHLGSAYLHLGFRVKVIITGFRPGILTIWHVFPREGHSLSRNSGLNFCLVQSKGKHLIWIFFGGEISFFIVTIIFKKI